MFFKLLLVTNSVLLLYIWNRIHDLKLDILFGHEQ